MAASQLGLSILLGAVIAPTTAACAGSSTDRVSLNDMPKVTFMHCAIPAGQPTWANITLTGGDPPFRAEWIINGVVDSTDPQRTTPVPEGTELAIRVTLTGIGQAFRVREFNRHGLVETDTWTNDSAGLSPCGPDGKPKQTS